MHDIGEIVLSKGILINGNYNYFGPIIILGKENNNYYGLKFSSYGKKSDFNKMLRVDVFSKKYNLRRLSVLDFRDVLVFNNEDIDKVLSKVSNEKLNSIMETIYFILKELRRKNFDKYYDSSLNAIMDIDTYNPTYLKGDILKHHNHFLTVINSNKGILKCYKTFDRGKKKYSFQTGDNRSFNIRYDSEVDINLSDIKKNSLRVMTSKYFMNYVEATKYAYCNNNLKDITSMTFNTDNNYDGIKLNEDYNEAIYYDMNNELFKIKNNIIKIKKKRFNKR